VIFQTAGGKGVTLMEKTRLSFIAPQPAVRGDGKWVCGWVQDEKGTPHMQVWDTATGDVGSVAGTWPADPTFSFLADNKTVAFVLGGH
jgi:hypothetical protein